MKARLAALSILLFLVACQPVGFAPGEEAHVIGSTHLVKLASAPASTPPAIQSSPTLALSPMPLPSSTFAAPLPTDPPAEPLRFIFPTASPQPQVPWRPPLYPLPWAPGPYDHFYFGRPISIDTMTGPVADYRYGGVLPGDTTAHSGIDIDVPIGTPILAAGNGKVVWEGYGLMKGAYDSQDPYGLAVEVRHDFGFQGQYLYTVYAHMKTTNVVVGQEVKLGQTIGLVGNTGNTTGPHLHFEVRLDEDGFFTTRNPELWLAPAQGWGILVGRLLRGDGYLLSETEIVVQSQETGEQWTARTYGPQAVGNDPYYRENLVVSDLPAGRYTLRFAYYGMIPKLDVEILPGQVTYFSFYGRRLFSTATPPPPASDVFSTPAP